MLIEPLIIFIASIISYNNESPQEANSPKPVKTEIKAETNNDNNLLLRGGWDRN
ncbi:MAG: hypothetical protein IPJ79_05740 [Bacteroidetes bacterium]|nr:hypothetical protein [Bacteroidota bacterium]